MQRGVVLCLDEAWRSESGSAADPLDLDPDGEQALTPSKADSRVVSKDPCHWTKWSRRSRERPRKASVDDRARYQPPGPPSGAGMTLIE
jgi:hypothetical protein